MVALSGVLLGTTEAHAGKVICRERLPVDARNVRITGAEKKEVANGQYKEVKNLSYNPNYDDDSWNSPFKIVPLTEKAWVLTISYSSRSSARREYDFSSDQYVETTQFEKACVLSSEESDQLMSRLLSSKAVAANKVLKLKRVSAAKLADVVSLESEVKTRTYQETLRASQVCYVHPTVMQDDRIYWQNWQKRCFLEYDSNPAPVRERIESTTLVEVSFR